MTQLYVDVIRDEALTIEIFDPTPQVTSGAATGVAVATATASDGALFASAIGQGIATATPLVDTLQAGAIGIAVASAMPGGLSSAEQTWLDLDTPNLLAVWSARLWDGTGTWVDYSANALPALRVGPQDQTKRTDIFPGSMESVRFPQGSGSIFAVLSGFPAFTEDGPLTIVVAGRSESQTNNQGNRFVRLDDNTDKLIFTCEGLPVSGTQRCRSYEGGTEANRLIDSPASASNTPRAALYASKFTAGNNRSAWYKSAADPSWLTDSSTAGQTPLPVTRCDIGSRGTGTTGQQADIAICGIWAADLSQANLDTLYDAIWS